MSFTEGTDPLIYATNGNTGDSLIPLISQMYLHVGVDHQRPRKTTELVKRQCAGTASGYNMKPTVRRVTQSWIVFEGLIDAAVVRGNVNIRSANSDIRMTQVANQVRETFFDRTLIIGVALRGSENTAIEPEHRRTIGRSRRMVPSTIDIVNAGHQQHPTVELVLCIARASAAKIRSVVT